MKKDVTYSIFRAPDDFRRDEDESKPMSKAKMVARIRSMQKEMGCPQVKARTLEVEYSESEVLEMYLSTCQTFNFWQRK